MAARTRLVATPSSPAPPPCRLLALPAELREAIWTFAVTEWTPSKPSLSSTRVDTQRPAPPDRPMLQRTPIRVDRLNRPPPPGLTGVSRQLRHETLRLYYTSNQFELWRPLFWLHDWTLSTLITWLAQLGPHRTPWLADVVLLYKHASELEDHDVYEALGAMGFVLAGRGVVRERLEVSEFEATHEALGLPRHFGRRGRERWVAGQGGG
ncbi:hypothetical protein LTR53_014250 [Teratosphaeriaceae sp. CCFEE 6253]|nr:hypothetical protein LTR53_014250 [Teratosphaeriaceae sp. CCFEE 6253]